MHSEAYVPTERASHYIKVLCGHFSHKVTAEFDESRGAVHFPFGECVLLASPDGLTLKHDTGNFDDLERAKEVVGGHLERFAYRGETIKVEWRDAP